MAGDRTGYDSVSMTVHWLTVILLIVQVVVAWLMESIGEGAAQNVLYGTHKSLGLILLLLVLFRLFWRIGHPWPPLPADVPRGQALLARANHGLLYLLLLAMPVSGFVFTAAGGYPVTFLGLVDLGSLIPKNDALSKAALAAHLTAQWVLYALVALHVLGALYHLMVRKDDVFARMLPRPATRQPGLRQVR